MNHLLRQVNAISSSAARICLAGSCLLGSITLVGAETPSSESASRSPNEAAMVLTVDTPWVVAADEPEAIQRALADVKADWYKVLGRMPVVLSQPPQSWTGSIIYFGTKAPWLKDLLTPQASGPESFVLRVQKDRAGRSALVAGGSDLRGGIYAAYALAEEVLGVDPWYYWTDNEPGYRGQLELQTGFDRSSGPPTFRYRGWFVNDEDLLAGFAPDPLRENIFSLEMWDRVYETLLRLRGNMVVPGTFNFPDERCLELAARRGLVLNMHHVNILGLNTFRWPEDIPFSYSKHPEIMEQYWRSCIAAYKGRETVWTVGYRGKFDHPFWTDEPELNTPQARGDVITRAIAKQVELIREAQPDAPIIANMWDEGAELYRQGMIKLPDRVTLVWPDDGSGLIRDNGQVSTGQGTYYHTMMLNYQANQLTEMINPGRIYHELGRFVKAGATDYFLVNVSDVRPAPLSTDCVMKFVWNAVPYLGKSDAENMDAFYANWSQRQFGPEIAASISDIYRAYFDLPYHREIQQTGVSNQLARPAWPEQEDFQSGENSLQTRLRKLQWAAAPLIAQGKPLPVGLESYRKNNKEFARRNLKIVSALIARAESLASQVPPKRLEFYQAHVLTPLQVHRFSLEMLEAYCDAVSSYTAGTKTETIAKVGDALRASDDLSSALRKAEYGKWAGFYRGECLVGLDENRDRLRCLNAVLRGEPMPPTREDLYVNDGADPDANRHRANDRMATPNYYRLYRYQEPFKKNFPLLYPQPN